MIPGGVNIFDTNLTEADRMEAARLLGLTPGRRGVSVYYLFIIFFYIGYFLTSLDSKKSFFFALENGKALVATSRLKKKVDYI